MANIITRRANTLPVKGTVTPADTVLILADGAPPDLALASVEAIAKAAAVLPEAKGDKGDQGLPGVPGPKGDALAIDGVVADEAALAGIQAEPGDAYVTADTGQMWVYSGDTWVLLATTVGPEGPKGEQGIQGPAGEKGDKGDQGPPGVGIAGAAVPVGTILDFAGTAAPVGFLLCDGTEYDRSTYPDLAQILVGSGWPQSANVGKFKVPNLSDKVTVGVGSAPFGVVGESTGSKDAAVIAHQHPAGGLVVSPHQHGVNLWTSEVNIDHLHGMNHQHGFSVAIATSGNFDGIAGGHGGTVLPNVYRNNTDFTRGATDAMNQNAVHRHAVNGWSDPGGAAVTGSTANPSDGVAGTNRNIQPSTAVTKIIRCTV
jgi:microcystin-dependent protein